MSRKVWAIRHVVNEDLGNFAPVLGELGYEIRYIEAPNQDYSLLNPLAPDLLVVLGGPMGVYEAEQYPFIAAEIAFLKARLAADLPTLGICLGAQLMAAALGASVYPGAQKEIGWMPIALTEAGLASSLAGLDGSIGPVFHWHGDTFDLPLGAVHLASSELFPQQAFSYGRGLALQFHPEVTAQGLESWFAGIEGHVEGVPGLTVDQLRQGALQHDEELQTRSRNFLTVWLARGCR
jgi:GMP synthase (glutamine-hydrolysing)